MKLEGVAFPDPIWEALRENNLVIFTGAGVSIGEPANLPSFRGLAEKVSEKTGVPIADGEKEDVFFGRLKDRGMDVHVLVKKVLSENNPKPTKLHKDILRLYSKEEVRIVTTNFDLLFEDAAREIPSGESRIETFDAPALPSGKIFDGIVHVHGSVNHHNEMVLTDRDFEHASLFEGWPQHFLANLFSGFTVLFIGYSHDDSLMTRLARALPTGKKQRFILTCKDDSEYWERLGIEPILYEKPDEEDHSAVGRLICCLADFIELPDSGWRQKIAKAAGKDPAALNEEEVSIVKIALGDKIKTRFFARFATSPEWAKWLDEHGYLSPLFSGEELGNKERELFRWLIEKFVSSRSDYLFSLISKYRMRLNSKFWRELGWEIGRQERGQIDKEVLSKWVSVMLSTLPSNMITDARDHVLMGLAKQCNQYELTEDLLRVFDSMMTSQLTSRDIGGVNISFIGRHHSLNDVWKEMLKPKIDRIVDTIFIRTIHHLEEQYILLKSWGQASRDRDINSQRRLVIEPNEQDKRPHPIHVLIDVARDCLELLASKRPEEVKRWCNQRVVSEAPLLRRLAVHAFFKIKSISADDKIDWLLKNIGLYDYSSRNEALKAIKQVYPDTGQQRRKNIVEAILAHGSEEKQHGWLYRLNYAIPDCEIVKDALDTIQDKYPELKQIEYIDWAREMEREDELRQSLWTPERLLGKPLQEQFQDLLAFQGEPSYGYNGLINAAQEVAKSNPGWGVELAEMLGESEKWDSNLWRGLMRAWVETELDEASHCKILNWLSKGELHSKYQLETAQVLHALVEHGDAPYIFKLLPQANQIAKDLWSHLGRTEKVLEEMPPNGWSSCASNRPAGILTSFWLTSFSIWRENQEPVPEGLSDEYRVVLSKIVQDSTLTGKIGRTILAGRFDFLLVTDKEWTINNILPLFDSDDDFRVAWDGFLTWGELNRDTAQLLSESFLKSDKKIKSSLILQEDYFVKFCITMLESFGKNRPRWIAELFHYGDQETRSHFAYDIEYRLRERDSEQRQEYWQRWLKDYWENRLDGVPVQLEDQEIEIMLNWLPLLESVFPQAVNLACRMPQCTETDQIVHDLESKDELINDHPEAIVRLLIYLEGSVPSYWWPTISEIIEKIPQKKISPELKKELKELKVRLRLD